MDPGQWFSHSQVDFQTLMYTSLSLTTLHAWEWQPDRTQTGQLVKGLSPLRFHQENPDLTDVLCVLPRRTTGLDFSESKEDNIPELCISTEDSVPSALS